MKQTYKTVLTEWTQYNGVGSRETLFKKYSVNCWESKVSNLSFFCFTDGGNIEIKDYYTEI